MIKQYLQEKIDNMTMRELEKYKAFDSYNGNGLGVNTTFSNGAKLKTEYPDVLDKLSIFKGVLKYQNSKEAGDFISKPKFVSDGRLGYTKYVSPIIKDAQEEYSRGI